MKKEMTEAECIQHDMNVLANRGVRIIEGDYDKGSIEKILSGTSEKILSISKDDNFELADNSSMFEGFVITTDKQVVKVGVTNDQCCCENFGCLMTEDNPGEFIGHDLISISIVDKSLNDKKIEDIEHLDEGEAMFVNFETTNGLFQIVAYNSHNGYYGHEAVVVSTQLTESTYL